MGVRVAASAAACSWATSRKPPVPQAGSTTVSLGLGVDDVDDRLRSGRAGVKYWPAPEPLSDAPLESSSS